LRYPDPSASGDPLHFSFLGGDVRELDIPRADHAAIQLADGAPTVVVLRSPLGPRESSRFDVYELGDAVPRQSPALPISARRPCFDGVRVGAAFGHAVRLFAAEDPTDDLGAARKALGGFVLSPHGDRLALLQQRSIDVHDATSRLRTYALDDAPRTAQFGPGGELAVIDRHALYLFTPDADAPLWRLDLSEAERTAGIEYRSLAVGARPADGPGDSGDLVVAAGRLAVSALPRRGAPIGAARGSVVAVRGDGQPLRQTRLVGDLPTRHFGNASPRVEILFGAGRGWIAARTADAVVLWEIAP
jgi:hypothetical protein